MTVYVPYGHIFDQIDVVISILMPKTSAPNMTKHITTSQYGGPLTNHMPKPNMQSKTICPNILCYNQILIFCCCPTAIWPNI